MKSKKMSSLGKNISQTFGRMDYFVKPTHPTYNPYNTKKTFNTTIIPPRDGAPPSQAPLLSIIHCPLTTFAYGKETLEGNTQSLPRKSREPY
jgi:hypothetical protein